MLRSLLLCAGLILWAACAARAQNARPPVESFLAVYDLETGQARVVHSARVHFEAPNWSRDGRELIYNSGGLLYRIPVEGGTPVPIDTAPVDRLNNDHGLSPDGRLLAISSGDGHIYTVPAEGGTPVRVTRETPSYWHGWSPDGRTLAYCARRGDNFDLYTIPVEGGEERRLTDHPGYDDGPDYSPDGRWIYFCSNRSGVWEIYRMPAGGGEAERMTRDADENWFPHPSPDGRHVVFLSFEPGTEGHPANRNVRLRLMPADGGEPRELLRLFGGQGTINVPSWSPDSRQFAFVYYRLIE